MNAAVGFLSFGRACLLICLAAVPLYAGEPPGSPSSSDPIRQWIRDWEAPAFSTRRAATQKLETAGADAYPPLADAAIAGSPETMQRSLDILRGGLRQTELTVREVAEREVKRIAASQNPSAARAAQELLREFEPPVQVSQRANMPAAPRPGMRLAALGAKRIVRVRNQDVTVEIQLDPIGRIRMKITRKQDGRETTEQFDAVNEADLKLKHPAAHAEFAKHAHMLQLIRGPGPQLPGNPAQNVMRQQQLVLRELINNLDASAMRHQQELARTTDARRAESLRSSLQRIEQQKAQALALLARLP